MFVLKSTCLCCRSGKCCNCTGTTTEEIQTINHLSLEIAGTSLFDCLSSYTNEEATKGTCSCCNCKHIDIKRRTLLTLIPEVIVFHLMRFQNNGKIVTKIHSDVDCPPEIDLSAYTSGSTVSSYMYFLVLCMSVFISIVYKFWLFFYVTDIIDVWTVCRYSAYWKYCTSGALCVFHPPGLGSQKVVQDGRRTGNNCCFLHMHV